MALSKKDQTFLENFKNNPEALAAHHALFKKAAGQEELLGKIEERIIALWKEGHYRAISKLITYGETFSDEGKENFKQAILTQMDEIGMLPDHVGVAWLDYSPAEKFLIGCAQANAASTEEPERIRTICTRFSTLTAVDHKLTTPALLDRALNLVNQAQGTPKKWTIDTIGQFDDGLGSNALSLLFGAPQCVARILENKGAARLLRPKTGESAVFCAAAITGTQGLEAMEQFLARDATLIDLRTERGISLLEEAVRVHLPPSRDNTKMIQYLIQHGAECNENCRVAIEKKRETLSIDHIDAFNESLVGIKNSGADQERSQTPDDERWDMMEDTEELSSGWSDDDEAWSAKLSPAEEWQILKLSQLPDEKATALGDARIEVVDMTKEHPSDASRSQGKSAPQKKIEGQI